MAVIIALCGKIALMRKAADEIREGISYRLKTDTNTLLDIASISHDIRTPLTAIRGYLELLEGEEKTENTIRYLSVISERTEVLSKLTEELFQYTVAASVVSSMKVKDDMETEREPGKIEVKADLSEDERRKNEAEDLGGLIEESLLASYAVLVQNGINPDVQLPEEKVKCNINAKIAHRIIENILNNATKYSDGDLHITLNEQGEVLFANHTLSLDAVQTGRLFDRFYTVENAKTATGLGLAIAKQLTEQMGGSIAAWYEDGMLYLKLTFSVAEE